MAEAATRPPLPSFSIIIETANLAKDGIVALAPLLERLERQTLPVDQADHVLLVDGSRVPPDLVAACNARWPWLRFHVMGRPVTYYGSKQAGSRLVDSEVCVFVDCDVHPQATWLEALLEPFRYHTGPLLVAGETRLPLGTVYGCAMQLAWWVHLPSRESTIGPLGHPHHGNNFATRREVLMRTPIPYWLPLYRGFTRIHMRMLREAGVILCKQPAAVVYHPLPSGIRQWFWWVGAGARDGVAGSAFESVRGSIVWRPTFPKRVRRLLGMIRHRPARVVRRARWMATRGVPRSRFLAALPLAFTVSLVEALAGAVTCFFPDAIMRGALRFEDNTPPPVLDASARGRHSSRS